MSEAESPIRLQVFGRTDVGQIREHNEDNFLVANLTSGQRGIEEANQNPEVGPGGFVLGVCDGMGGAAAGEVASQFAVDLIYEQLTQDGPPSERDELARRLVRAIEYAGSYIFQEARADRSRRGMGTTATVAALLDRRLFVGQVGDSRAYLLRQGKLVQLTRDQSLANQLIEAGQLTEEEAETFEHNNIILQALGTAETVQVDLTYLDLCRDDVLLLCSDGLSGMIKNEEILATLLRHQDLSAACRELTDKANAAGGHDNITVVLARVEAGVEPPRAADSLGYQKYALPSSPYSERPEHGESSLDSLQETVPESRVPREFAKSSEAPLRVAHTMIGTLSPLSEKSETEDKHELPPSSPRHRPNEEDPVNLPTQGIPPLFLVTLVISAMILAAVLGYLALR